MKGSNNKGFSLLELLIVVAIILIIATIAIPSLLRSRQAANESAAVANLRTINTAQITYLSSSGGSYGTVTNLITEGLIDATFDTATNPKAGYLYALTLSGVGNSSYDATATPASDNTGRYGYYSGPDAVIRYQTTGSYIHPNAGSGPVGNPVQ
jgi:prepilin-type N-terminal cleavage/methylation domain-containing protein